eukprot:scaffold11566_cov156-Ochromonas_danica.AAC.5
MYTDQLQVSRSGDLAMGSDQWAVVWSLSSRPIMEEDARLICQGAEAKVYETTFLGRPAVCKERLRKSYRVPELDQKINKQRLTYEVRCIAKCLKVGVPVPW